MTDLIILQQQVSIQITVNIEDILSLKTILRDSGDDTDIIEHILDETIKAYNDEYS